MGKEKYQKRLKELFKKSPVVSVSSIQQIVRLRKKETQYAKQLIRNLAVKGAIKKLTKGYYTIYDEPSLCVFCFKPAYLGLQDALSFHNLWEQETIPIVITTRKVRSGLRNILGVNVMVRRIDKKYFFGYDYYPENEFYFPYSDKEKTFIDMLYFGETLSPNAIASLRQTIDKKKLFQYLKHYPKKIQKRIIAINKSLLGME